MPARTATTAWIIPYQCRDQMVHSRKHPKGYIPAHTVGHSWVCLQSHVPFIITKIPRLSYDSVNNLLPYNYKIIVGRVQHPYALFTCVCTCLYYIRVYHGSVMGVVVHMCVPVLCLQPHVNSNFFN